MMIAGIDCGTNSVRLLIGQVSDVNGRHIFDEKAREMIIVRLGQGVDETGAFAPDALQRLREALETYAQLLHTWGVEKVRFTATSASRDVSNRDEFVTIVRETIGVEPEVISGNEEAALSFYGATAHLDNTVTYPVLLVDIGGGSTEFVLGDMDGTVLSSISINMGSVRVYERFFKDLDASVCEGSLDPLRGGETWRKAILDAVKFIDAGLDEACRTVDMTEAKGFVGVAGTVTTVAATALELDSYRPECVHNHRFTVSQMVKACLDLENMTVAERSALGFMPPGRADVIGAGALVFERILQRFERAQNAVAREFESLIVSEHDILDGITSSVISR